MFRLPPRDRGLQSEGCAARVLEPCRELLCARWHDNAEAFILLGTPLEAAEATDEGHLVSHSIILNPLWIDRKVASHMLFSSCLTLPKSEILAEAGKKHSNS